MSSPTSTVADLFFQIVPQVMRVTTADLRRSSLDIEPIHIHLLGLLVDRHCSLGELAETFSVSPPTMSNTISTLEAHGWVERRRSEEDRRIVLVHLTPAGERILADARAYAVEKLAEALDALDEAELGRLRDGLLVLGDAFSYAFPAVPPSLP